MISVQHLRDAYEGTAPFATVVLDVSRNTEDADHQVQLRWRAAAERLTGEGAAEDVVTALAARALDLHHEPGDLSRFLVADTAGVTLDLLVPGRQPDHASLGPLPELASLVEAELTALPHVLVVVDRLGAEVSEIGRGAEVTTEVEGSDQPVRKVPGGGWSHRRFQQRAENMWERNAKEVAEAVSSAVRRSGAQLIAVAGDVRAAEKLVEQLPQRDQEILVRLDSGSRSDGSDEAALREELGRAVALRIGRVAQQAREQMRQELGRGGAAADGTDAVLTALQRAQVATLVIRRGWADDSPVWVGPEAVHLARDADDLSGLGVEHPQQARLDAAVIRAAVGTDATVELAVGQGADVAALLRYADGAE